MAAPLLKPVIVYKGASGNISANSSVNKLKIEKTLHPLSEPSDQFVNQALEDTVEKVRELLESITDHDLDENQCGHANAIALNTAFEPTLYKVPVHLHKTSGRMLLRTTEEVKKILRMTHDDTPLEKDGKDDPKVLHLYFAKFKAKECLFITPDSMCDPRIYNAFDLETVGDTIGLMSVKACDASGYGRSRPILSIGKFNFLFPGHQIEPTKRAPAPKRPRELGTKEEMLRDLEEMFKKVGSENNAVFSKEARSLCYGIGVQFVQWMAAKLDDETFVRVFAPYLEMHPNMAYSGLGRREDAIVAIKTHITDEETRAKGLKHIDGVIAMITGSYEGLEYFP